MRFQFDIVRDIGELLELRPQIQQLADSEREALGFLPGVAIEEAITRRRLFALTINDRGKAKLTGYLFHSGVFPHAKIQQIAVAPRFRKAGVASTLMRAFASELEHLGFLTIKAEVASDLSEALRFYAKCGFEIVRERPGGQARNRSIFVHIRQLDTDNLFSVAKESSSDFNLGVRRRSASEAPFYAFDLNVYFDLARDRAQSHAARRLFAAALRHEVRLAVADEFVHELQKTSHEPSTDPILQMALQLPRLPKIEAEKLTTLADHIHDLVFTQRKAKGAESPQSRSDAKHLAHAALSRASSFVTRDGPILAARNELLSKIGLDIATIDELVSLLVSESPDDAFATVHGDGFINTSISAEQVAAYLAEMKVSQSLISEFDINGTSTSVKREAVLEGERVVAVGVLALPKSMEPVARMLIHVRPEHVDCEMFADLIFTSLVRFACRDGAISLELAHLPGQSTVTSLAKARGFFRSPSSDNHSKIAIGRPLTTDNWSSVVQTVRRRTGLVIPDTLPPTCTGDCEIQVSTPAGKPVKLSMGRLETMLGPTLFIWPGREGVIVPIARAYADDLLGTSPQPSFEFIVNRDAAFLSRRGYVNSPRAASRMQPDSPILFYESKRTGGGRGAAVAIARIVDSIIVRKSDLPKDSHKRLVVDNIDALSASDDVLYTTFDNLFALPKPIPFKKLKEIDAIGEANLVSAVSLSSEKITSILAQGWSSDGN